MSDIVIAEFMDQPAIDGLAAEFDVLYDAGLWQKRDALEAAAAKARALIVRNRTQVDKALLDGAPRLKAVGRLGVGLDNIDVATCKARGIEVLPAIGANAVAVAEYAVGLAIVLLRGVTFLSSARLAAGEWPREEMSQGREAAGKTFGIVGFGSIGQVTGALARAAGMTVIAHDDFVPADSLAWKETRRVTLDALLAQADVISLHCPLTPATRGLIGPKQFAAMRKGAVLINAARGGVVDEAACAEALRRGDLGGAALDVFETEPITTAAGHRFAGIPNVVLTPHIAGVTRESNARISDITAQRVRAALKGGV
jgi:(S)-sulfolactate dehydrogenase